MYLCHRAVLHFLKADVILFLEQVDVQTQRQGRTIEIVHTTNQCMHMHNFTLLYMYICIHEKFICT